MKRSDVGGAPLAHADAMESTDSDAEFSNEESLTSSEKLSTAGASDGGRGHGFERAANPQAGTLTKKEHAGEWRARGAPRRT